MNSNEVLMIQGLVKQPDLPSSTRHSAWFDITPVLVSMYVLPFTLGVPSSPSRPDIYPRLVLFNRNISQNRIKVIEPNVFRSAHLLNKL